MSTIKQLAGHKTSGSGGFTLIEIILVVVIIAILLAIAIPMLLGARARAQIAACQENMSAIGTALEGYYAKEGSYTASQGDLRSSGGLSGSSDISDPAGFAYTITLGPGNKTYTLSCTNSEHTFTVTTGGARQGF